MNEQAKRELVVYEYRIESTPHFKAPIDETWELFDVLPKWNETTGERFILVFRKPMQATTKGESSTNGGGGDNE